MFVTSIPDLCGIKIKVRELIVFLMNVMKLIIMGMVGCLLSVPALAENNEVQSKDDQKKGAAIITIFSDFHTGFGNVNDDRGFDLERAYIGFLYNLPH